MILGKEPAVIIGGLAAAVGIACGLDLSDGVDLGEGLAIAAPILGIFGIRATVYAPDTVEQIAFDEYQYGRVDGEEKARRRAAQDAVR